MDYTLKELLKHDRPQVVFADYDDTLFAWQDVTRNESGGFYESFLRGEDYFEKHPERFAPVPFMQEFMKTLSDVDCYVLTWLNNSLPIGAKWHQSQKHYPGVFKRLLGSKSAESKVDIIKLVVKEFQYKSALLIDDHPETVCSVRDAGFYAISPMGVYSYCVQEGLI